ncbi:hypothetical protein Scep_017885 [Stephania cephalantha]|uniref:Poor homologous synapsis 1 PH domain-containing protein n=1 Tax=Stephania cephalantha TaxID=152367 RepID=A0AAP0IS94_9MAGN
MAGTLALRAPEPENLETSLMVVKQQWEVEFARFFNYPTRPSFAATSPYLRPISRSRTKSRGTWLSSSSKASVKLISDPSNPETIVVVIFRGMIVEEHFTSNLHFTWPQVSCVTECPPRGSRVVFANYRDCGGQANMKGSIETGIPTSDLTENSSQSEFVASNRLQYSGEELGLVDHVAIDVPQIAPVLNDHNYIPNVCSLESYQHYNLDRTNGDFPPSFTELMTNCSAEAEKATNVPEEFDISSQLMITQVPEEFDIKSHLMVTKVPEEFDIKSQIMVGFQTN